MATLTVTTINPNGTVPPSAVSVGASGDLLPNTGKEQVDIANGSGGSITVTVAAQIACDQQVLHDITNTIANGATERMGPFSSRYTDTSGYVHLTYSATSSVTIAAFRTS